MKTRMRIIGYSIVAFLFAFVQNVMGQEAAGVKPRYTTMWLPDQSTEVAGKIDFLFDVILWITSVVFVIVFVLMIYFMIRYRHRDGRKAIYSHGNTKLEIIWTVIPALIVIALGFASKSVWSQIKQDAPPANTSLIVQVTPRQFEWKVRYAGADGKFDADSVEKTDDIRTINQLHVPAGKDVIVILTAEDVIHSFFVPEFRIKQDAVPGMVTRSWFNVPKPGKFEIACAELCGLGHYRMRAYLTVHSQGDFDKWYNEEMAKKAKELAPPPPTPPAADTAAAPSAAAPATDTAAAQGSTAAASTSGDSAKAASAKGNGDTAASR